MKILSDSIKIKDNTATNKCRVINETILLLPSQTNKYLGSVERHKLFNIGIVINKDELLDVVCDDVINSKKWLLIIYNNKYYYTPYENIDTSKLTDIIHIESAIATKEEKNEKISGASFKKSVVAAASDKMVPVKKYEGKYLLARTIGSINLYGWPEPGKVLKTIGPNKIFTIQSQWQNTEYNKTYFCTQSYTKNGTYLLADSSIEILGEYSNKKALYYSMVYMKADCKLPDGSLYGSLNKGDMSWPYDQDWDDHIHKIATQSGNVVTTYTYPAASASPLADSSDMFDKKYFGVLVPKQPVVGWEMHRIKNAKSSAEIKNSLESISVKGLNKNTLFNNALSKAKNNYNDLVITPSNSYIRRYGSGDTFIVTNYISSPVMNYYICFLKSYNINGAIAFCAIPDVGVDYISYTQGIPDYSLNIDSGLAWVEDVVTQTNTAIEETYVAKEPKFTKYPENEEDKTVYPIKIEADDDSFVVPGVDTNAATVPPEYDGWKILSDVSAYNLSAETPYDNKHLSHINRFGLLTNNSMLSTKSFIFVTRPDLNLYHEIDKRTGSIDGWAMNPDLKRLPTFKYLARLRGTESAPGIGNTIMNSLECFGTSSLDTPWLSVFTNQARGYSPVDREIDITEMGETFHGSKVIYAEPTFRHKIANQISIPFTERRDLTLYYTLRLWIDYIQAVSLGYCEPRFCHKYYGELDYAVSLYFIQTDETMENIIYWEKLTGLIPLLVPDSFFEWSEGDNRKNMEYNITFAYSFRTVMDEYHLSEINNLYSMKATSKNIIGMPMKAPDTFDFNNDAVVNQLIARVGDYYGKIHAGTQEEFNAFLANKEEIKRFYYNDRVVINSSGDFTTSKFLPNWNKDLQMHGIPYVKGPFIEHDPKSQTYKLRWI